MNTTENSGISFESVCGGVFLFVGLCLLLVSIIVFRSNQNFHQDAHSVKAVITNIQSYRTAGGNRDYDVWVSYEIDDETYNEKIGFFSSSMHEGETLDIMVDNNDPTRVRSAKGGSFAFGVLLILGSVFTALGGFLLYLRLNQKK